MISETDRQRAVTLIDEAMAAGARQAAACGAPSMGAPCG